MLGDIKYGNRRFNEKMKVKTQLLCAVQMTFKELGESECLSYLSGKTFALEHPKILDFFAGLKEEKNN